MSTPTRFTSGFTQDRIFQPLGNIGQPNPFYYATYYDDFIGYVSSRYIKTITTAGTISQVAGANGRVLFTTNATTPLATDIAALQIDYASIALLTTNKASYLCRIQLADVVNSEVNVGFIPATVTPFTVTDGLYLGKASGATQFTLYNVIGSVVQNSIVVPFTPTNNVDFDLSSYYNARGSVYVYAGSNLVGHKSNQNKALLGPAASIEVASLPTITLNPTLALMSGAAASTNLNVDFHYSAVER